MAVGRRSNQYSFASRPRGADNTATQTGFYIDIDGSGGSTIAGLFASNTFSRRTFTRPFSGGMAPLPFHIRLDQSERAIRFALCRRGASFDVNQHGEHGGESDLRQYTLYLMRDGGAGIYTAGRLMNSNIHAGAGAIGLGDIAALYRAPWSMFRAAAPLYTSPDAPAAQPAAAQYRHFLCM